MPHHFWGLEADFNVFPFQPWLHATTISKQTKFFEAIWYRSRGDSKLITEHSFALTQFFFARRKFLHVLWGQSNHRGTFSWWIVKVFGVRQVMIAPFTDKIAVFANYFRNLSLFHSAELEKRSALIKTCSLPISKNEYLHSGLKPFWVWRAWR